MIDLQISELKTDTLVKAEFINLYNSAFPIDERRIWSTPKDVSMFMKEHPMMRILICNDANSFVGFMIYWVLDCSLGKIIYLEHFATQTTVRGKGYGTYMLHYLLNASSSIMLEVEPPIDEVSKRRVKFYRKNGFTLRRIPYIQPSYHGDINGLTLKIMSTPQISNRILDKELIPLIRKQVYGCKE